MNSSKAYLRIFSQNQIESAFNELISNKTTFFGYFHGSHDDNGVSWCGDCDQAKPFVEKAMTVLEGQDKIIFAKFSIERAYWKNMNNFLRTSPKTKLTNVPTLVFYQNGVEFGRLVEGELFDYENVKEFISQSLE